MLDSASNSMPKSQIFGFIIDNDYTNYFTLMQAGSELIETGFIEIQTVKKATYFAITKEGQTALESFADRIPPAIREDIGNFFVENQVETKNALNVETNYYRNGHSGYIAELSAKEKSTELLHMKINVPTEEAAASMCKNFEGKSEAIYDLLIDNLL